MLVESGKRVNLGTRFFWVPSGLLGQGFEAPIVLVTLVA